MSIYAEPIYDKIEMLDLEAADKKDIEQRRLLLARRVLASANMVDMAEINSKHARMFHEDVISGRNLTKKMIGATESYGAIFELKAQQANIVVHKKDVGDFVLAL